MEGIKRAAKVYYEKSSPEERARLTEEFDSMDEDKNGKISKDEFLKFMDKGMPTSEKMWLFAEIDEDRSGSIEFHEFMMYFYIINYGLFCDCCEGLVADTCYSCVRCREKHSNGRKLFQVCEECYKRKLYKHEHDHAEFKDNHVLFQANETSGEGSFRELVKSILKREEGAKRKAFKSILKGEEGAKRKAFKSILKVLKEVLQVVVPVVAVATDMA